MQVPRLYSYFRSGAAHRVRIALALKGIAFETFPVHLVRNEGEHLTAAFRALNPQARLPVYELSTGETLIQSPAILEYLEETVPEPPLLPAGLIARAKVRGVAALIGCDVHPLTTSPFWQRSAISAMTSQWCRPGSRNGLRPGSTRSNSLSATRTGVSAPHQALLISTLCRKSFQPTGSGCGWNPIRESLASARWPPTTRPSRRQRPAISRMQVDGC